MTEFGPSNFAKFDSLSSQTYLSAVLLEMQKGGHSAQNMAAGECGEMRECCCAHLFDAVRFLEGGNHDSDTFDYTAFRLDWVLNCGRFARSQSRISQNSRDQILSNLAS